LSRSEWAGVLYGTDGAAVADAFDTEPEMWFDLQQQYDLWQAAQRRRPK